MRWSSRIVMVVLSLTFFAWSDDARAFCGFYVGGADSKLFNDATMVVMMREGTRTVLAMQNAYKGPPEKFAMVVPVPVVLQEDNVKTLPNEVFDHVDKLASPRLVEYWEQDPCAQPVPQAAPAPMAAMAKGALRTGAGGGAADLGVTVEAKFTVGEYQIVILSAKYSSGLETWLHQEKYTIPEGAKTYFQPYVAAGSKFFVAKVDIAKVKMENGLAVLSPLRFHYDSDEFRLPVRLGLINSSGTQDLIVHIVAKSRYEVANYENVTIPTNIDVAESAADKFGTFYTTLFDKTLEKHPKSVVTEYAWTPTGCDPCPGPALAPNDLATLGYDVLPSGGGAATKGAPSPPPPTGLSGIGATPGPGGSRSFRAPPMMGGQWVLTRLHARYTKDGLGDDLVFKEAGPIVGGREIRDTNGDLEHGAKKDYSNNFQARYAIRHPWLGPITCKEPKRGVWGGNPKGGAPPPKAAAKLGLAEHTKADLASFVRSPVPELALAQPPAPSEARSGSDAGAPSDADAGAATAAPKKGCGSCATASPTESAYGGAIGALGFALAYLMRRKRSIR